MSNALLPMTETYTSTSCIQVVKYGGFAYVTEAIAVCVVVCKSLSLPQRKSNSFLDNRSHSSIFVLL